MKKTAICRQLAKRLDLDFLRSPLGTRERRRREAKRAYLASEREKIQR